MKSVFVFPPLRKHQAGQHDQETHGNWATGNFTPVGKDGSYDVYEHPSGSKIYFQTNPAILDIYTKDMKFRREEAIGYVDDLLTRYPLSDVTFVFGNGVDEKYRASGVTLPYFREQGKESWGFPLDSEKPNSPEIIESWISTNVPNISREKIKGALVVFQPEMFERNKTGTPKTFGEVAVDNFMAFAHSDSHAGWNKNGLKTIITHEYGHLLDQRTYEKSVSDFGSFPIESTSDYGRKNSRELFAETFTAWELERDNPKYQAGFKIFNFNNLNSLIKSISGFHIQESLDPNFSYVLIEFGDMQKHQAGQHDQKTHGSWATANGYKLALEEDLPALESMNYDPTVRYARDNYIARGYTWMNEYLRDGYIADTVEGLEYESEPISKEEAIGLIDSLKSALYETQTTQDLTVTRWTRTGESIIGEKISEASNLKSLIGKTYHAKGFTSTSVEPDSSTTDGYKSVSKVLANIHMPAGTYGATVYNSRESEFLLAPDTFFVVMGASNLGEGRISLDLLVTGQGDG